MKKSLLALAVAAIAATSSVSATTVYDKDGTSLGVYGRVQSVFYSDKQSGVSNEEASIKTSARFGVDMRTQLTAGTSAFALAEWEASNGNNVVDDKASDTKSDANFYSRLMWVGLDFGQMGSVKVGKFEEAIKYALYATDFFEDYGCLGYAGNDDRREGVVQYQWSGSGLTALVSYAFAKDNEHLDGAYHAGENVNIDYSVSAAVGYTSPDIVFGPVAVRAGYIMGKMNNGNGTIATNAGAAHNNTFLYLADESTGEGAWVQYDKYSQWALGVSWGNMNLGPYVGAQFQKRTLDLDYEGFTGGSVTTVGDTTYITPGTADGTSGSTDASVTGYEFAFGYGFANGVTIRTAYQTQKYELDGEDVKAAVVPVFLKWQVNPRFDVWAEARFDAGTDDDNNGGKNWADFVGGNYAENVYSAGLRYAF